MKELLEGCASSASPRAAYRCCFLDRAGHFARIKEFQEADDGAAILRAVRLLAASDHAAAELYQHGRLVQRVRLVN